MAAGRLFRISKSEIGRYELPRRPRMRRVRRNGMGVTAIMGISNGRGAFARHLRKNRVGVAKKKGKKGARVVGGLSLYSKPPAKHRRAGAVRPSQYAYPEGYRYPVHDKAHVYRALRYYARYRNRYSRQVRRTIEQGIAKAAKRFGVTSPYASQLRRKFNINPEGDNMLFTRRRRRVKRNKAAKKKPVRRMRTISVRRYKKGKGKARRHVGYAKYVVGGRKVALTLTSRGNIRTPVSSNKRRKTTRKYKGKLPRPVLGIRRVDGKRIGVIYGARSIAAKPYKDRRRGGKRYITALVTNRRRRRLTRNDGFYDYPESGYTGAPKYTLHGDWEAEEALTEAKERRSARARKAAATRKARSAEMKKGKRTKKPARRKGKLTKAQRRKISLRNLRKARLTRSVKAARRKNVKLKRIARRKGIKVNRRRHSRKPRRARRVHARRRFAMNPRRKSARRRVFGKRRYTRRNASLASLKSMLPTIGTVFGGFVLHKFLTGLVSGLIGKYTKGSKSISAVAVALASHMFGDKVVSKKVADDISLGMFASLGHTLLVDLVPSIAPKLGLGTSQSLLPRYAVGDYYEAASGSPFVQAAAGEFVQAAAGVGEYFSNSGSIAGVPGGAAGEYFVSDLTMQGTSDYEVLPQAAAGMGAVYDGVRPDGNLEGQFQMMEAAAGVGAYAGRSAPSNQSIYIPQENALAVGQGSSGNAGIFDQGTTNGILS